LLDSYFTLYSVIISLIIVFDCSICSKLTLIYYQVTWTMSQLDPTLIRDLGLLPTRGPIEIPLYARFRPEVVVASGHTYTRSVPRDVSSQELTSVLLRLTDFRHFTRYLKGKEIKKEWYSDFCYVKIFFVLVCCIPFIPKTLLNILLAMIYVRFHSKKILTCNIDNIDLT